MPQPGSLCCSSFPTQNRTMKTKAKVVSDAARHRPGPTSWKREEGGEGTRSKADLTEDISIFLCLPLQIAAHPRSRYRHTMSLEKGPRRQKSMEPQRFPTRQSYFEMLKRHARPAHALSPARKRQAGELAGCVAPHGFHFYCDLQSVPM